MPYVLSDSEYADFRAMRKLYIAGRGNGDNRSGPVAFSGRPNRGPSLALVEITGNESGGEIYTCDVYEPANAFFSAASGNTSANIKGTLIVEDAIFINVQGVGLSTHTLTDAGNTSQKFFIGLLAGVASADGRPIYVGNAIWLETCP